MTRKTLLYGARGLTIYLGRSARVRGQELRRPIKQHLAHDTIPFCASTVSPPSLGAVPANSTGSKFEYIVIWTQAVESLKVLFCLAMATAAIQPQSIFIFWQELASVDLPTALSNDHRCTNLQS